MQQALESRRARLQTEAQGIVPEEVVVLETIGTVDGFIRAVEKVPGMEWLGEIEEEEIPPDDDFFALGGHSLMATQVVSRIREAFDIELPVVSLFECQTMEKLAERVENARWALRILDGGPKVSQADRRRVVL